MRGVILCLLCTVLVASLVKGEEDCYLTSINKLYSLDEGVVVDFKFDYASPDYKISTLKKPWSYAVKFAVKEVDKSINTFLAQLFDDGTVHVPKEKQKAPVLKCFELEFNNDESKRGDYIACHYVAIVCSDVTQKRSTTGFGRGLIDKVKEKLNITDTPSSSSSEKRGIVNQYEQLTVNVEEEGLKLTLETSVGIAHGSEPLPQYPFSDVPELSYILEQQSNETSNDTDVEYYRVPRPGAWGVDRINRRYLPLENKYRIKYPPTTLQVNAPVVYVIDTAIFTEHPEFNGRASRIYDYNSNNQACNPHGTHVAGIIAGETVGINPYAIIKGASMLDCDGQGDTGGIAMAMNAIIDDCDTEAASVINLSLGGSGQSSTVDNLFAIAKQVCHATIVAAAGNSASDACTFYPAGSQHVITVAASDVFDYFASFSNYGTCVEVVAPGVKITSSVYADSYASYSGTSMASPHVAGVASLYAGLYGAQLVPPPSANGTSIESAGYSLYGDLVRDIITSTATSGTLKGSATTQSKLLFVDQAYLEQPLSPASNGTFPPGISTGNTFEQTSWNSIFVMTSAFFMLIFMSNL